MVSYDLIKWYILFVWARLRFAGIFEESLSASSQEEEEDDDYEEIEKAIKAKTGKKS